MHHIPNLNRREIALQAIRCEKDEPKAPARLYPEDDAFDAWIERARQTWVELNGLLAARLKILCAMALIPEEG